MLSFFLPVLQVSLGIKLSGWEVTILHFSEIIFLNSITEYIFILPTIFVHLWIIGLIIGYFLEKQTVKFIILSSLSILSSFIWLILLEHSSVLLIGYYLWLFSILLIITGRILNFFEKKQTE